jgi:hypothetical protein
MCGAAMGVLLQANGSQIKSVEINFLCVLKKLRSKRLAPVLIKVSLEQGRFGFCQYLDVTRGTLLVWGANKRLTGQSSQSFGTDGVNYPWRTWVATWGDSMGA